MAYAKATLADLKQSLADRHDAGVIPADSATLNFYIRLLNRGQDFCADRIRLVHKPASPITTTNGSAALPVEFLLINKVYNSGNNPLTQISQDDSPNYPGALVFWISGDQSNGFYFNVPSGMDDTFQVWYTFNTAPMVNDSDVCYIQDPEAVVSYAYSLLRKSETDPVGDAQDALNDCLIRLNEMIDQYTRNDSDLGFSIMDGA